MRDRRHRGLAAWLLAGLALPMLAHAAPALWSAEGRGGTVWLFGSIHALAPGEFTLAGDLAQAWRDADAVWLEIDPQELSPAEAAALIATRAIDPAGRQLDELLGTDAAAIRAAAAAAEVDLEPLAGFEPWFAATLITMQALIHHGYRQEDGVERVIERKARADGKPVHGLESLDEQLALLDRLPPAQQRDFLRQTLDEYTRIGDEFMRMKSAWQDGDDAALTALLEQGFAPWPGLAEALVTARNRRWADRIAALLDQGGDALVVVGALHLVGDEGLPALLAARGFRMTRH